MPLDGTLKRVMVIGSGPIVIGQQRNLITLVLRLAERLEEGLEVVL